MNGDQQGSALLGALRRLPKVQLHCHLEGTVQATTFAELAARYGVPTEYRPKGADAAATTVQTVGSIYHFSGFQEFLFKFAAVCRCLQQPTDYARVLREYAEDAAANGVMYAELFVSPQTWRFFHKALDVNEVFAELRATVAEVEAKDGLKIRFTWDLTRNFGVEAAIEATGLALKMRDYGVIAIGLGGDEANFPARDFEAPFRLARESGLRAVAHAGEADGAHSVHHAIAILGAERIGHGFRAIEDPEALDMLKERDITLEICPTSNFRTGVLAQNKVHPLVELDRVGIPLTIDSDDPAIFETDISNEYTYAASVAGIDATLRFAHRAIEASFADESTKRAMTEKLTRASAELLGARRT